MMPITCDTFWPLLICLRNFEITSLSNPNWSILCNIWLIIRLMSQTWHVYSTDSLKKSSSKAIPRSQRKVTFCPNPIGFPFLARKVFSWKNWMYFVFYQSGRRFELIGGLGGWRQATQSQGGSRGAEMILLKKSWRWNNSFEKSRGAEIILLKKDSQSIEIWVNHLESMSYPIDM